MAITYESIQKTIADIALEKLKTDSKGFYHLDFLMAGKPVIQAEAGLRIAEALNISLWGQYDISDKKTSAGIRIGGEFSL